MLGRLLFRDQGLSTVRDPDSRLMQALLGFDGAPTHAGPSVNADTALRISTVYACVTLIAGTIGALPRKVYRRRADGTREELRLPGDRILWGAPNDELLGVPFWETVVSHLLLRGNGYIGTDRNDLGRPVALFPLDPRRIAPTRDPDTGAKLFVVDGARRAEPDGVLHIPGFGTDGLQGLSPISQARQSLGLTLAAEEFGARFFGNGSTLSGILTSDRAMSEDEAKRNEASWRKAHGGRRNAWKVAVLDGGLKWQSVGVPPQDAQYLELRKFQRAEICAIFRVPPHMIGDVERSTSWGTGIEQQAIGFITYTLLPWLRRIEEAVTERLLSQENRYFRFDVDGLLRGAQRDRYDAYRLGREAGFLSVNDIRRLEDLPPVDGGDDFLQPLNYAPLGSPAASGQTTKGATDDQARQ